MEEIERWLKTKRYAEINMVHQQKMTDKISSTREFLSFHDLAEWKYKAESKDQKAFK